MCTTLNVSPRYYKEVILFVCVYSIIYIQYTYKVRYLLIMYTSETPRKNLFLIKSTCHFITKTNVLPSLQSVNRVL